MNHVVSTIKKQLAAARENPQEPSRVFVISTYVIGKERILLAVRVYYAMPAFTLPHLHIDKQSIAISAGAPIL